ncbi:MAG: hypothetical protein AAB927_01610, partial [Patescibacteria group bacterium]
MKMNPEERWHPKPKEKTPILSRRNFLVGGSALGLVGLAKLPKLSNEDTWESEKVDSDATLPEDPLTFLNVKPRPKTVQLGRLAERVVYRKIADKSVPTPLAFGGDYEMMLGITEAKAEVTIDPHTQLSKLWKEKLERIHQKRGLYPPEQLANIKKLFLSYDPEHPNETTLEKYRLSIQARITGVRSALNMNALKTLPQFKNLDMEQMKLVKDMVGSMTADTMLSYILTELMPTTGKDTQLPLDVMDVVLRYYGRDYFHLVPARHDPDPELLSFGAYQLTPHVLQEKYRIGKKGAREEDFQGASVINKLLPPAQKLPADLTDLKGNQHHVAAYLFAVYNIAYGVRLLGPERSKALNAAGAFIPAGFAEEFLAAAHHRPADAIDAFKIYTDAVVAYAKAPEAERARLTEPDYLVA